MAQGLKKIVGQFEIENARGTQEFERATDESIRRESARIDALEELVIELRARIATLETFHP